MAGGRSFSKLSRSPYRTTSSGYLNGVRGRNRNQVLRVDRLVRRGEDTNVVDQARGDRKTHRRSYDPVSDPVRQARRLLHRHNYFHRTRASCSEVWPIEAPETSVAPPRGASGAASRALSKA